MIRMFARDEQGQALVIVGLAMVVLMGALVMTVDWGYGLTMRRAAQNQADAGVLAAAKLLATSYTGEDNTPPSPAPMFDPMRASRGQVWNAACEARNANTPASPVTVEAGVELTVSFFAESGAELPYRTTSSSRACTLSDNGTTDHTVFVSVRSSTTYESLFGRMFTSEEIGVTASARARLTSGALVRALRRTGNSTVGTPGVGLSGASTAPNVALWPIALRYFPPSDPPGSRRIQLWPAPGAQFVSFSHFSGREADLGNVHQLITESDYTQTNNADHHGYSSPGPLPNGCGGVPWDTNGSGDSCDVPNWFTYGFRGSVSIGTDWRSGGDWDGFLGPTAVTLAAERPDSFPVARDSCTDVGTRFPHLEAPSCDIDSSQIGDWVETVSPVDDRDVATAIRSFIDRYGRDVPSGGEKAVVVNIPLWDCGEDFDPNAPVPDPNLRNRWLLNLPGSGDADCSRSTATADRVHLFVMVPVLVRLSDVPTNPSNGNPIYAEWGDLFGDAGSCAVPPVCGLNPMLNSAFLVPDE
jgi:Flp pilus assembly protein TadG